MIIFYADNFTLNLTNTKITLVEENPLFFNSFVKEYSYPFTKELDEQTSQKLGFLELDNTTKYRTKYKGKIQIDKTFSPAYLEITDYKNNTIEGSVYYGKKNIALMEKPLSELPFPKISLKTSLESHAREVVKKQYPKVSYNFPMVINRKFKEKSNYKKFEGIINNFRDGRFITNDYIWEESNGEYVPLNKNVLAPFAYLIEVLKTGFDTEHLFLRGSFVSDPATQKILLYTDKWLEKLEKRGDAPEPLNIFPKDFSLSEMMPDITFGDLLTKIKNWLNLEVTIDKNVVTINYIENKFLEIEYKDERSFEVDDFNRSFSHKELYQLTTIDDTIFINADGIVETSKGYSNESIVKIDIGIGVMPINKGTRSIHTAVKTEDDDSDFSILLYDGMKEDLPVAVPSFLGRDYSLTDVYHRYWKKWILFRLRAEVYRDNFIAHVLESFNVNYGRFKYGKKHIYKKISKKRISEEYWQIEVESESLG